MAQAKCSGAMGGCGSVWVVGWLFAIGYLHLSFWKAVLAVLIWPYSLGATLGPK